MSSSDSKKEEFRKYLERSGVVDNLTKVLIALYEEPEKPANAIEFVRRFLTSPGGVDVDALVAENEDLKAQIEQLQMEVERLQQMQQGQEHYEG